MPKRKKEPRNDSELIEFLQKEIKTMLLAMHTKCYFCKNGEDDAIKTCGLWSCPLHKYLARAISVAKKDKKEE